MSDKNGPSREDLHKHLEFIQAVVTRMSAASTSAKSWLLPVVTATYGYGMTQSAWSVIGLGLSAVLLFLFLDAHYLGQEKAYRALYDAVAGRNDIPPFSLDPREVEYCTEATDTSRDITSEETGERFDAELSTSKKEQSNFEFLTDWLPDASVWKSWTITPFYGALIIVGVILLVLGCFS